MKMDDGLLSLSRETALLFGASSALMTRISLVSLAVSAVFVAFEYFCEGR